MLEKSLVGASAAQWRATVVATLRDWKYEPDLLGVRDALTRLPKADRLEWAALWADVDADRVRAGVPP